MIKNDFHYYYHLVCENGVEKDIDFTGSSQEEADARVIRNNKDAVTYFVDHKLEHSPLKSFELIKVTDPHDDISPQMWKTDNIEFTTLEDMLERQVKWCKEHAQEYREKYNWPDTFTDEEWTNRLCDSVKEAWGVDTPDSIERKERRKEWEIRYSKKYMSKQRRGARLRWAREYARMWNEWDFSPQYDKWTLQEMLEACGYRQYWNLKGDLVVLPCFDDDTPPLDHNDEEIDISKESEEQETK